MLRKITTNNAQVQTFSVNSLNELTTLTRGTNFTLAGFTTIPATNVTVNGATASPYADNTFAKAELALLNGTNTFTAVARDNAGRVDTNALTLSLSATNSFAYDANGNLTTNGTRVFEYDDENQLTRITEPGAWKSEFTYDGKMRRRIRKEYEWRNGAWVRTTEVRYVYDGNLVLQERNEFNLPTVIYTRGLDLSGSLQGAGGIGGLLAMSQHSTTPTTHSYYHADGNGNVTMLIYSNQTVAAKYLYDPFGNTLAASGPLADANLYRFSSKELHPASALVYYLYRYYEPTLQRWPNRDPLGEEGAFNLYGFVNNEPLGHYDEFGLLAGPPPVPISIIVGGGVGTGAGGGVGVVVGGGAMVGTGIVGFGVGYGIGHYTGFHDWLGNKVCQWQTNDREKCRQNCDDDHDSDSQDCRNKKGKDAQRKCLHDAFDRYSRCLADCNK